MSPPPPQLPSFLRRRLLLHEARRALLGGAPEDALDRLADPCLALSEDAERLREKVVDVVCREASRAAAEGDPERADLLLRRAAREDPKRAAHWRRRIDGETDGAGDRPSVAARAQSRQALGDLLAEMRREAEANGSAEASDAPVDAAATRSADAGARSEGAAVAIERSAPNARSGGADRGARPTRFHLAVDDAGDFLAVGGDEVVIGHRSSAQADLPILGDLDSVHARILRSESFHGGAAWMIQPAQLRRVRVAGRDVPEGGTALFDGARVELSPQVAFDFHLPDPGSCSALIEWRRGIECEGAQRVLLFAQGPAGRVRAGFARDRHVVLRGTHRSFELELVGGRLRVASPDPVRVAGANGDGDAREVTLDLPPSAPTHLSFGRREAGRPPFGISLRAVERRGSGEWGGDGA